MSMALLLGKGEDRPPRQLSPEPSLCMLPVPVCRAGGGGGSGWPWCKATRGSHGAQPLWLGQPTGDRQNCSHVRGECRDLQAGTSTPREADRGGYLTHHHQGTFWFQCQPLWTSCGFTLRWLGKWMISLCCKADYRAITGSYAATAASKTLTSPLAVGRKWRKWLMHPQSHQKCVTHLNIAAEMNKYAHASTYWGDLANAFRQ